MQEDVLGEVDATLKVPVSQGSIKTVSSREQSSGDSPPRPRTDDPSTVLETYDASDDDATGQRKLQDLSADIVGIHLGSFHGKSSMKNFANVAYRVRLKGEDHTDSLPSITCSLMRPVRPIYSRPASLHLRPFSGSWRRMKLIDLRTSSHLRS